MNHLQDNAKDQPFASLALRAELLHSLDDLGIVSMTPIQARALPPLLAQQDVIARARTGSGKTIAFGLSLLQRLEPQSFRVQALVLCPTRELADQVASHIRQLARHIGNIKVLTLCGGTPIGPQIGSLKHSAHIIVGTPGRVLKHLRQKTVRFNGLQSLVLDEADRMLDMGFSEEIDAILEFLPGGRQTLLFSATYPDSIAQMSSRVQRKPVLVDVTEAQAPIQVAQYWLRTARHSRMSDLVRALNSWGGSLNLVFCNTKVDCAAVSEYLIGKGISAVALHGDMEQADRSLALVRLHNHSATVLVATDVAARGLDIQSLDAVFNYELPTQAEVYVHRIGRTGRAGQSGTALSLVAAREESRLVSLLEREPALEEITLGRESAGAPAASHLQATMRTIEVNGGRKNKLRAGDLLGALTAGGKIPGSAVGRIELFDNVAFVAVAHDSAAIAVKQLNSKIKGRLFKARFAR